MSQDAQTAVVQTVLDQDYVFRAAAHLRNGLPGQPARIVVGSRREPDSSAKPSDASSSTMAASSRSEQLVRRVADGEGTLSAEEPAPAPPQGTSDQRRALSIGVLPGWAKTALVGASLSLPVGTAGYFLGGGSRSAPAPTQTGGGSASLTTIVEGSHERQPGLIRWMIDRGYNLPEGGPSHGR